MYQRLGKQTVRLRSSPAVLAYAGVGGKKEGEGPLKECFDFISEDSYFGEKTWEKAESHMIRQCFTIACGKARLTHYCGQCCYLTVSKGEVHLTIGDLLPDVVCDLPGERNK